MNMKREKTHPLEEYYQCLGTNHPSNQILTTCFMQLLPMSITRTKTHTSEFDSNEMYEREKMIKVWIFLSLDRFFLVLLLSSFRCGLQKKIYGPRINQKGVARSVFIFTSVYFLTHSLFYCSPSFIPVFFLEREKNVFQSLYARKKKKNIGSL